MEIRLCFAVVLFLDSLYIKVLIKISIKLCTYATYAHGWLGALSWYSETTGLHLISLFYSSIVSLTRCYKEFCIVGYFKKKLKLGSAHDTISLRLVVHVVVVIFFFFMFSI